MTPTSPRVTISHDYETGSIAVRAFLTDEAVEKVACAVVDRIVSTRPADSALGDELAMLVEKAFSPNPREWYVPWRVVPDGGKPIIAGSHSGNLFRGYIGTWQDADLIVGLINNLPAILSALRHPAPRADDAMDDCAFCLGAKGGVPGNENCYGDILICDHCSALLRQPALASEKPTGPVCTLCGLQLKGE